MRIAILKRARGSWGGDWAAIERVRLGLSRLGHEVHAVDDAVAGVDLFLLTNTCTDQRAVHRELRRLGQRYAVMGFHEASLDAWGLARGFFEAVRAIMGQGRVNGVPVTLDRLWENPNVVRYFAGPPRMAGALNHDVLRDATVCVASTSAEARTILDDCPSARVEVVPWDADLPVGRPQPTLRDSLDLGEYVVQVGRLEVRKNQLGTLLALADLPQTLVFVATRTEDTAYERTFLAACRQFRAPRRTVVVSQTLPESDDGALRVVPMPGGEKLPWGALRALYEGAAAHVHPAFMETPGLTYLESAQLGVPTVISEGATAREYFYAELLTNRAIRIVSPCRLADIRRATESLLQERPRFPDRVAILERSARHMAMQLDSVLSRSIAAEQSGDPRGSKPPRGLTRAAT